MSKSLSSLVTGGAGFIGSHLCRELLNKGQKVICIDNLITGNKKNIAPLLSNPNFQFIEHDIVKPLPANLQLLTSTFQFIYHLASPASPVQYQKFSIETLLTNSIGTYNMLELARIYSARFLLASTSEVYGDPEVHPQKETYWGNVNPVGPRSCYDESKRFAEALTMEFIRKNICDGVIVRIFNTYGPNMQVDDGRVISNFITQALLDKPLTVYGDGRQTRSFCFVTDLIEGLIKMMEMPNLEEKVLNLGNPDEKEVLEIAETIRKLTGSKSKIIYLSKPQDDPGRRKPDISRIRKETGWQPKINLNVGLRLTIDYFRHL